MAYDPRYPVSIYNMDPPTRRQIDDGERVGSYTDEDTGRVVYSDRTSSGAKVTGSYDPNVHRLEGGQLRPATMPWE